NKLAPPFKEVEFDILYGQGVSREGDLVDLASDANIVDKSGAWYSFNGERIGQGRENAKQFLVEHPDVFNAIEAKVLAHQSVRRIGVEVAAPTPTAQVASPGATPREASDDKNVKSPVVRPVAPATSNQQNGKRPNA